MCLYYSIQAAILRLYLDIKLSSLYLIPSNIIYKGVQNIRIIFFLLTFPSSTLHLITYYFIKCTKFLITYLLHILNLIIISYMQKKMLHAVNYTSHTLNLNLICIDKIIIKLNYYVIRENWSLKKM